MVVSRPMTISFVTNQVSNDCSGPMVIGRSDMALFSVKNVPGLYMPDT